MNHGLMTGMFWGGVLLSAFPVLLGIGVFLYILKGQLEHRRVRDEIAGKRAGPQSRASVR